MYIHKAVKEALKNDGYIKRKMMSVGDTLIKPTNSSDCCYIIIQGRSGHRSSRCWNPTADDLIADDWEVTKG